MGSLGCPQRHNTDVDKQRFYLVVGGAIAHQRDLARLTLRQLAERVGCNASSIQSAEQGHSCSLFLLVRIAEELDVNVNDLIPENATR